MIINYNKSSWSSSVTRELAVSSSGGFGPYETLQVMLTPVRKNGHLFLPIYGDVTYLLKLALKLPAAFMAVHTLHHYRGIDRHVALYKVM